MSNTDNTPTSDPEEGSDRVSHTGGAGDGRSGGGRPRRLPSRRLSIAAAAATLGVGIAIGAALGPGPQTSLAGTELPGLLGALFGHPASAGSAQAAASTRGEEPAGEFQAVRRRRHRHKRARVSSGAAPSVAEPEASSPTSSSSPTNAPTNAPTPVTSVWLIELSGESFSQALAQPAAAPYIDTQLMQMGTFESAWTALDGSAFASYTALAGLHAPEGSPSPIVQQIIQPACPEGAAGVQCQPGTPGQLTTADAFAKQTIALVSANALYRAHGLIVVTFGSMTQASAAGLPEGATSSTLTAQPPAGVLLISPFVRAGARSTSAFDPTSPTHALSALLGK
jgi:hypothetical protein